MQIISIGNPILITIIIQSGLSTTVPFGKIEPLPYHADSALSHEANSCPPSRGLGGLHIADTGGLNEVIRSPDVDPMLFPSDTHGQVTIQSVRTIFHATRSANIMMMFRILLFLAQRKARAPLPAGADTDQGNQVIVTGGHRNRAAGRGCHGAACWASFFDGGASSAG